MTRARFRIAVLSVIIAFVAFVAPRTADADDDYRTDMVVTDGIGSGLIVAGLGTFLVYRESESDTGRIVAATFGIVGLWTIILGSPIIHLANGERTDAFLSLGLRSALPVSAGYLGKLLCGPRLCSTVGGVLGMIGGMALDHWLLAGPSDDGALPLQLQYSWSY